MGTPKLLLLAMDAADSHLVRRWAREGYLPTIARMLGSGVVVPIATPPAVLESTIWPTCLTGASPANHGMFATLKIKVGTYDMEEAMYADRLPYLPFWAHLSRAGKRVAAIDVPFARPVKRLRGIQVTNWGAHDSWAWERSSWPPRLIHGLVERFGDHPVGLCDAKNRTLEDYEGLRARLLAGIHKKTALLRYCLDMDDWDFFFGVFSESHCAGHQFWHFMDPEHPRYDLRAPRVLQTAIRDVYQAIDTGLAALLQGLLPEVHVLLMLSHGMGPWYDGSHLLDLVLERLGVNEAEGGARSVPERDPYLARRTLWGLRHLLPATLRQAVKTRLPNPVLKLWTWAHPATSHAWQSRRAFAVPSHSMTGGIRINLKGREPAGLVQLGQDYDALCRELTEVLLALKNADTGRRAVQWVARADTLYRGAHLREMPDLFVEWDHSAPIRAVCSPQIGTVSRFFHGHRTGEHWKNGLLAGLGPRFRSGEVRTEIRTQDLAPTILEFFGVQSPPSNEGKSALSLLGKA
jgi:predicted AlkP superfamily phosphohydrolase/phosphomutase